MPGIKFYCLSARHLKEGGGNFGAFGGPWHRLHRPSGHYVGPQGCSSTRIVTEMITQTHPRGNGRVSLKIKFRKIFRCH